MAPRVGILRLPACRRSLSITSCPAGTPGTVAKRLYAGDGLVLQNTHYNATILRLSFGRLVVAVPADISPIHLLRELTVMAMALRWLA